MNESKDYVFLDPKELLVIFKRYYRLLLIAPCVALLVSFFITTRVMVPIYKAETLVLVMPQIVGQLTYNELLLAKGLVKTYREIVRSREVLEQALQSIPYVLEATELRDMIEVGQRAETEIIVISVESSDAKFAAVAANAVAEAFKHNVSALLKLENVTLLEKAVPPTIPAKPRHSLIWSVATFTGFLSALCIAFLHAHLDNTFKTSDELEEYLRIDVLGMPTHASRLIFKS